ncbi:unnamed protein product [Vitrella brassicaformis CCMP3155]|uniref:Uncharacterized protein n=1 Tax=Vitrella brassicaformis (strain CCMP3155) TaxID=1169540 RepID=A0A0G4EDU0_VITBC|nr:unnamed protein product [Vitrella brassicaformis CCMP3155]|eukprot:CEL93543.1 unnamed protein product [Vitrella brassicaformis CCMP3155]
MNTVSVLRLEALINQLLETTEKEKQKDVKKKTGKEGERASSVWDRVEPPMAEGPSLGQGGVRVSKRQHVVPHGRRSNSPILPSITCVCFGCQTLDSQGGPSFLCVAVGCLEHDACMWL